MLIPSFVTWLKIWFSSERSWEKIYVKLLDLFPYQSFPSFRRSQNIRKKLKWSDSEVLVYIRSTSLVSRVLVPPASGCTVTWTPGHTETSTPALLDSPTKSQLPPKEQREWFWRQPFRDAAPWAFFRLFFFCVYWMWLFRIIPEGILYRVVNMRR